MTSLETPRLILRPFQPDDWQAVLSYTSLPEVMRYLPEAPYLEETAMHLVNEAVKDFLQSREFPEKLAVVLKSENRMIGHMIFESFHGVHRTRELGYLFHPKYHRQGFATEASQALLQYGFDVLHLHRIIATCDPRNPASFGVMEKLGMRREAHFKKCIYRGGDEWWDEYFYAILDEDWAKQAANQNSSRAQH